MTNSAPERASVGCPHCGKRMQVPTALLGKTGKCPGCQANFTITATTSAAGQLVSLPPEETPFTPGPAPVYPNQERIAPDVLEPSLPKYLLAQIMSVVFAVFLLGALFVIPKIVGSGKTSGAVAMGIALFGGGSLFTACFGGWLIHAGVQAFVTRRIPLSRTSQLRGVAAQIGAVFFILCGLVFSVGMAVCLWLLIRESLQAK